MKNLRIVKIDNFRIYQKRKKIRMDKIIKIHHL